MKTSIATMVLTTHLIVGLLYLTSPSFAEATTVIPPEPSGSLDEYNYLPLPEKPAEDSSFKLLSAKTNQNPTMEWPQVASTQTEVVMLGLPLVCTIITITICLVVLGVIIHCVIKMIRCLHNLITPTNRPSTNDELASINAFNKASASASAFETPRMVWGLPSFTPLESSTNLQNWFSYLVISNQFLQMDNTDCYLLSTVYRGGIQLTSILKQVFLDTNTWIADTYLTFTNMDFAPVIGTNQAEFFRGCGSNYISN